VRRFKTLKPSHKVNSFSPAPPPHPFFSHLSIMAGMSEHDDVAGRSCCGDRHAPGDAQPEQHQRRRRIRTRAVRTVPRRYMRPGLFIDRPTAPLIYAHPTLPICARLGALKHARNKCPLQVVQEGTGPTCSLRFG
jgi:hypothetical protein